MQLKDWQREHEGYKEDNGKGKSYKLEFGYDEAYAL
jgi:hypothetical protein